MKDDQIAVKMLSRYKEIRKNTFKRMADVEMMLGLLDVVREYDIRHPNQENTTDAKWCDHCGAYQLNNILT